MFGFGKKKEEETPESESVKEDMAHGKLKNKEEIRQRYQTNSPYYKEAMKELEKEELQQTKEDARLRAEKELINARYNKSVEQYKNQPTVHETTVRAAKDIASVLSVGGGGGKGSLYPYKETRNGTVLYRSSKGGMGGNRQGSLSFLSVNPTSQNADRVRNFTSTGQRQGVSVISSTMNNATTPQMQPTGRQGTGRYQLVTSRTGKQYYRLMAQSGTGQQMANAVTQGSQLMQPQVPQYANKVDQFFARDAQNPFYQKSRMLTSNRQDTIPFSQKASMFISQPNQQAERASDKIKRMLR